MPTVQSMYVCTSFFSKWLHFSMHEATFCSGWLITCSLAAQWNRDTLKSSYASSNISCSSWRRVTILSKTDIFSPRSEKYTACFENSESASFSMSAVWACLIEALTLPRSFFPPWLWTYPANSWKNYMHETSPCVCIRKPTSNTVWRMITFLEGWINHCHDNFCKCFE